MVLPTTFFGPVSWYEQIARASEPVFIEAHENFQKQTLRTRCRIATANGYYLLSVIYYPKKPRCHFSNGVSNKTNRLTFKIKDYALTHVTFVWIILAIAAQRENLRCHRA